MARRPTDRDLLALSKSSAETINNFRRGAHLAARYGQGIDQLVEVACRDRFSLGRHALNCAASALRSPNAQYRVAVGRAYYAMYHIARAVVYFVEGGDDHESHQEVPKHLPKDFPDRDRWENELKKARLERNRADYDPYPRRDSAFATNASSTVGIARQFLPLAKRYLVKKGCRI